MGIPPVRLRVGKPVGRVVRFAMPSIPDTLAALRRKHLTREAAVEALIPELDRLLAMELIPVVGGVVEAVTDQLLRPIAGAIVNGALRTWAAERKAAKGKK